ncbi:hypothetical protein AAW14_18805 [Streptomyces hygroscopicus]|uniref:beta-ketoacyl synthase N-terminal-like domain-containing protein n=1 Tax=Streptomyces hygroscopicus TaxID=1912 RepID=UPI00223FCDFA|nr:beta-ketoacyl synthase N-terminal-like domain-containing protein [Streptomyces hygroscopicus]MCW7944039.1 hypothetical protein [Streptomyces hygroscopicus]
MTRAVISAWAAVSPFGIGGTAFAHGVAAGRRAVTPLGPGTGPVPQDRAAAVPGFDVREVLGRKGTRSLDRVSALSLATVDQLLGSDGRHRQVATGEHAAVVLGTTLGSAKSMMDITRDTLTQELPYFIDAARIPNAVMNSAAAQCAIRHGIKGPNTTVAGGRTAGLFALRYALRLLSTGRARAVLCGGAEELTGERAWLEHHGSGTPASAALGEGCGMFLVEPSAEAAVTDAPPVLAEILAVETAVHTGEAWAGTAADCLRRALTRAGATADEIWAISPAGADGWDEAVRAVCAGLPDGHRPVRLPGDETWGDAGAATASFQIASVLVTAEQDPSAPGRLAVVTSFDQGGVLGCALLRVYPYGTETRTEDD